MAAAKWSTHAPTPCSARLKPLHWQQLPHPALPCSPSANFRFKNARAARRLAFHERHPRIIPAICRIMSPLVLIFGPLIGVPAGKMGCTFAGRCRRCPF